jgi:glutamate synthase domain-containing protein 2
LVGKTADHNFRETAAFMSMVSRSAERDPRVVQNLAAKLTKVSEEDRDQLCDLAKEVAIASMDQDNLSVNTHTAPSGQRRTVMRPSSSGR